MGPVTRHVVLIDAARRSVDGRTPIPHRRFPTGRLLSTVEIRIVAQVAVVRRPDGPLLTSGRYVFWLACTHRIDRKDRPDC